MKRLSFILVFLCLFIMCTPVFSFAATNPAPVASSVMTEPVPSFSSGSDYDTYEAFMISYLNGHYTMFDYTILVPHGHTLTFHVWTNYQWRIESDVNYKISYVIYNALTGAVEQIKSEVEGNNYNMIIPGQWPNNGFNCTDAFFILPDEITLSVQNTQFFSYDSFIDWAPVVPYVHSYSSYLSEPIADPYNRYIVLAGDDNQYIFLLSFSLSDLTMFNSQSVNQGGDEIDLTYNNVFTPVLKLDNNQLKLQLDIDPQIFYILNNTDNHLYKYNLMFAKYNLLDGQYISSSLYSGSITSSTTSLAFDFGLVSDYDSIKTYGVQYIDELTSQWHYNMLHCSWGHDPDFEAWQENILFYLEGIYSSLTDSGDTDMPTTDPSIESGVNEYVSDEAQFMDEMQSGETQVDIIFEEYSSRFASNENGFSFVKEIFEDFVIGFPLPYSILFMSLVFGFVLVVIGRKVSKS